MLSKFGFGYCVPLRYKSVEFAAYIGIEECS
jgi:hypothetical protein